MLLKLEDVENFISSDLRNIRAVDANIQQYFYFRYKFVR